MVVAEQLEERRLGSRGALAAAEPQRLQPVAQLLDVEAEVLHPERGALAHGGELRGLEVRVGEAGEVGRADREALQRGEHGDQPAEQQAQAVAHHDEIRVVGDERAGGAEVEEGPGGGRLIGVGVHVRHHVVAVAALVAGRGGEVHVVQVRPKLRDGLIGDRETELALRLREREPEPAPQADAVRLAPETLHGGRRVARAERRGPALVAHRNTRSVKVIWPSRSR